MLSRLRYASRLVVARKTVVTRTLCSKKRNPSEMDVCKGPPSESVSSGLDSIFANNKKWVEQMNTEHPGMFEELGKGQSPDYLYIGCADSRVDICDMTGLGLGQFFVHRNIANMVVSSDMNLLAVLDYAVNHLKVKHILVAGHYDCGGVKASLQKHDYGQVLDSWLQNIRDVYRLHKGELDSIDDAMLKQRRLVELNVVEQCLNLYKTQIVQNRRKQTYQDPTQAMTTPRVHGLVIDPSTGKIAKIPIDYRKSIDELRDQYDLFDNEDYAGQEDHVLRTKEE